MVADAYAKNTPVTGGCIFNRENEMGQIWVIYSM